MPRDSQRSKVYAAEGAAFGPRTVEDRVFPTLLEVKMAAARYRLAMPELHWPAVLRFQEKKSTRSRQNGTCFTSRWTENNGYSEARIALHARTFFPEYVIHEMAHAVTPVGEAHGPKFCATYLHMLERAGFEDSAEELRIAFRDGGVQVADEPFVRAAACRPSGHGGKRVGAGRPAKGAAKKVQTTAQIDPDVMKYLQTEAKEAKVSVSFLINLAARERMKRGTK
jgi:hypothetical protein